MFGLTQVIFTLSGAGVRGELWIDGSFLTEKMDPEDVDIILRIAGALYDNGTPAQRAAIDWIGSNLKASHHCDSYYLMEYPQTDPRYWAGEAMYAYWMRQWTFSRRDEMKGIAVLDLPVPPPVSVTP